jgi:hypothetical protein
MVREVGIEPVSADFPVRQGRRREIFAILGQCVIFPGRNIQAIQTSARKIPVRLKSGN